MFWDKKHKTMTEAIKLPLKDGNEIGATLEDVQMKLSMSDFYPDLFRQAYGNDVITEERIVTALSQFIQSMNTFQSKFDKIKGDKGQSFTAEEKRGEIIFTNFCNTCHMQGSNDFLPIFGDLPLELESEIFFNGYRGKDTSDKGATEGLENSLNPLFKMPTLRNVALTAPYMHDGGLEDLDALINFYSDSIIENFISFLPFGGLKFTPQQKGDLKAFLMTLTDESFALNKKWSDPFDIANSVKNEDLGASVKVYPNPINQAASIEVSGYPNLRKDITIRNMKGQVVKADYFFDDAYIMNKGSMNPGMYIMTVSCQNKVGSYKLMVQ
jgi:cytochrome c peroxidase